MAIELSSITFTDQDDRVPVFGQEQIFNTGIANTLAGRDIIEARVNRNNISTALPINIDGFPDSSGSGLIVGIYNDTKGIIDTGDGEDVILGISTGREEIIPDYGYGIINRGIINTGNGNDVIDSICLGLNALDGTINRESEGIIDTGDGDDQIRGSGQRLGIVIEPNSILDSGKGDDYIRGTGVTTGGGILNNSYTFYTGDGDDTISGFNLTSYGFGVSNNGVMDTGNGNDIIDAGTGNDGGFAALQNSGVINTGNGNDSLLSRRGSFSNRGVVFLGDDEDSIIARADFPGDALIENFGFIGTGNANDTITSTGVLYNEGIINTGNGDDFILADKGFQSPFINDRYSGSVFLREGEDYIKGFGDGNFYGGNDEDTLELTPGSYTVEMWDTTVAFTKGNQLMITSEFEKLIAGNTLYDFTSFTEGQIITVA